MKVKKIAVLFAAIILIIAMSTACSSKNALEGDPVVGEWTMTNVEYLGQNLTAQQLIDTGAMTDMPVFNISEDGTCTFSFMGTTGEGNILVEKDGKYKLTDEKAEEEFAFEIDDSNKLKLDYAALNMTMIFEKGE